MDIHPDMCHSGNWEQNVEGKLVQFISKDETLGTASTMVRLTSACDIFLALLSSGYCSNKFYMNKLKKKR